MIISSAELPLRAKWYSLLQLGAIFSKLLELGVRCCSGFWRATIHTLAVFHVEIGIIYAGSILASQGHISCLGAEFLAATTLVFHLVCFKRVPVFHQGKKCIRLNTHRKPPQWFLWVFGLVLGWVFFNSLFLPVTHTYESDFRCLQYSETLLAYIESNSIQWNHINTLTLLLFCNHRIM